MQDLDLLDASQRREPREADPTRDHEMSAPKRDQALNTYTFTLIIDGPDATDEPVIDALFEAGCDDALFGRRDRVQFADFDRGAPDLATAVVRAIDQVESVSGMRVLHVEPEDLVSASVIAERTARTRESVRLLIEGKRGPGGFPNPVAWVDAKTRLWHWSDVANWFMERLGQRVGDLDDAQLIAAVNAGLETRNRINALQRPSHRAAVAHIVGDSEPSFSSNRTL
jgi:hypothetical protein